MPTGYTAELCERDLTFEQFALTCARAFGACILMRDEPLSTPIPEQFETSDYHSKEIAEAKMQLERLLQMPIAEQEAMFAGHVAERRQHAEAAIAEAKATNDRLTAMLEKAKAWQPPSGDHAGLKDFMCEQLTETIRFDGHCSYSEDELGSLEKLTRATFMASKICEAERDIEYHEKELAEETERTRKRNEWVKQLRDSLKGPEPALPPT